MRTRALLLPVVFGAAVTGCAPLRTATNPELDCRNAAECRVQVSVNCTFAFACGTTVEYERIIGKRNGEIVWELQNQPTQSYTFDRTNGIVFPSDSRTNFRCHVEADGRRFSCTNRGDPGQYKYTINLTGSPSVGPLDPWVVNN